MVQRNSDAIQAIKNRISIADLVRRYPRQIMNNSIARKKEMAWMKKIGVVGREMYEMRKMLRDLSRL